MVWETSSRVNLATANTFLSLLSVHPLTRVLEPIHYSREKRGAIEGNEQRGAGFYKEKEIGFQQVWSGKGLELRKQKIASPKETKQRTVL